LSVVLCPYVHAGLRGHSVAGCPFEHDSDRQRELFLTWAQWEEPEDAAVPCSLDTTLIDWGPVSLEESELKKFVVVFNKAAKGALVVEEVYRLGAGFTVTGHAAPVDGFVPLAPPVRVASQGHHSLGFSFAPAAEGFFECHATLSCNRRSVSLRVTLQALVLSKRDHADLHTATARLALASSFFPLALRDPVWRAPATVFVATGQAPPLSEGLHWTPVELAYHIQSLTAATGPVTLGAIDEPLAQGILTHVTSFDFLFRVTKPKKLGNGSQAKRRLAEWSRSRIATTIDQEAIAKNVPGESHSHRLLRLLVLEELAVDEQVQLFDQYEKELTALTGQRSTATGEQLYSMTVPGASEQRPQLQRGDYVRVRPVSHPGLEAVCTVHAVNVRTSAVTVAAPELPGISGISGKCHVRFAWPHARFRRMYSAVLRCGERFADPQIVERPLLLSVADPWDLSHLSFAATCRLSSEQKKGKI
jgi:hypothetical protein